jgi:hypothetical protein
MKTTSASLLPLIGDWAASLPDSAWTPGTPPVAGDSRVLCAVRVISGRTGERVILVGRVRAFQPLRHARMWASVGHGPVLDYVMVGD